MNYSSALEKLFNGKETKFGLKNILEALHSLSNPEKSFRSIHIAGTNGKGSVSTKIAKTLQLAGYRVGLFTSPHISTYRERIQVNGVYISEEEVFEFLKRQLNLTFFETTTALAFHHFASKCVDYAVIETGLGGRLDATNCIVPELSIITSIALDHTEILGSTLEAIAIEKAGIIKESVPLILGPRVDPHPIKSIAASKQSPFLQVFGDFTTYDEENNAIAKLALKHLQIENDLIEEGCKVRPPCRIEAIKSPLYDFPIILDVAHNPDGLKALFRSLKFKNPSIIVGLSSSKDVKECLKVLVGNASHLYLVKANHPRGASTDVLKEHLEALSFTNYTCCSTIANALKKSQGPLVICGTFFIMDEARVALGLSYPRDPTNFNERN